ALSIERPIERSRAISGVRDLDDAALVERPPGPSQPAPSGHPFVPNADVRVQADMLAVIGAVSLDELYAGIPERLRCRAELDLPGPVASESELERRMAELLARDTPATEVLSFLGGGCWDHYVPALCDEIAGRAEFLTAYWASAYSDHGKYQAFFEY